MDRAAWQATIRAVEGIGHDLNYCYHRSFCIEPDCTLPVGQELNFPHSDEMCL